MLRNIVCTMALASIGAMAADNVLNYNAAAWTIRTPKTDTIGFVDEFAGLSPKAVQFKTPQYKAPMEQWPAWEQKPAITDWSQYDRILIDVVNPNETFFSLGVFISDAKVPFRQGGSISYKLQSYSLERQVYDLSKIKAKGVDLKGINIIHFYTDAPKADMTLYVASALLLKKGEPIPQPSAKFLATLAAAHQALFDKATSEVAKHSAELLAKANGPQGDFIKAQVKKIQNELVTRLNALKGGQNLTVEAMEEHLTALRSIGSRFHRVDSICALAAQNAEAGIKSDDMLVGFADSMTKILPKEMPFELLAPNKYDISVARNEREAFQVAVVPKSDKELTNATVSIAPLAGPKGAKLSGVEIALVGYVQTVKAPPYKVSYVGWWPDPILNFKKACNVLPGDVQTWWIRLNIPKDQPAGLYSGKIVVSADGVKSIEIPLSVQVRSFVLPDYTMLPTAIHTGRPWIAGDDKAWATRKFVYADFLADYGMDWDQLYRQGAPDWEIIKYLHDKNRLVAFNLWNVFNGGIDEKQLDTELPKLIAKIRPVYEKAIELGVIDHAYIYGFDERGKDQFGVLERCAQALKAAFPKAMLMTTSYDDSFGADSIVKTMDAWCPLTPKFDIPKAENARKAGKFVWWYICCGPHNPHANWFVEYAAIESRLVMGAMPAKFRPDGFLYYSTTIWNSNKGIGDGPYTQWNPVSWTTYHGDGSLFHADAKGFPLPSIRLENYRDGMEDYAYARLLEYRIECVAAKNANDAWLAGARKALEVPKALVDTMAVYSHDPALLRAWRDSMAQAIETCPIAVDDSKLYADVHGLHVKP